MLPSFLLSPPPPFFPPKDWPTTADDDNRPNMSAAIIVTVCSFAVIAVFLIHALLRRRSRDPPRIRHLSSSSSSSSSLPSSPSSSFSPSSSSPHPISPPSDLDLRAVIDSLPLFSLSSSHLKSSTNLDCAVCLSPFQLSDELRLLPACRHAFHSGCVDTWLKSSLTCPLCRSQIHPIPPPPPAPAAPPLEPSESFRVEIGSVSRRIGDPATAPGSHARSYSLGDAFEYRVEDEIEAVLAPVRRPEALAKTGRRRLRHLPVIRWRRSREQARGAGCGSISIG